MKITTIVRARNEEKNIGRFIEAYLNSGVDSIVVSDGGSDDKTIEIASSYDKVTVLNYGVRVEVENGLWRNPNGAHWNFLIKHAIGGGADWLLHDDADCVPNKNLQGVLRQRLEEASQNNIKVALAYRIYMWKKDKYFPELDKPGQGLFGFTRDSGGWFKEDSPHVTELVDVSVLDRVYKFEKPEVLLHYFCPDEETVEKKMRFYIDSGEIPGYLHPLEGCGRLVEIESWMIP